MRLREQGTLREAKIHEKDVSRVTALLLCRTVKTRGRICSSFASPAKIHTCHCRHLHKGVLLLRSLVKRNLRYDSSNNLQYDQLNHLFKLLISSRISVCLNQQLLDDKPIYAHKKKYWQRNSTIFRDTEEGSQRKLLNRNPDYFVQG